MAATQKRESPTVVDLAGVDPWYRGAQNLYPSLDACKEPRRLWTEMVGKGHLGARTGRGFFTYEPGDVEEIIKKGTSPFLRALKT